MNQSLRRVEQPDAWSCLAAVAVMITGETMAQLWRHVGHDGGQIVPDSPFADGRRGFRLPEIAGYLSSRGYHLGICAYQEDIPNWIHGIDIIHVPIDRNKPALLIVQGASGNHAVLWTGCDVIDPHPQRPGLLDLEDYTVLQWWPVWKVA